MSARPQPAPNPRIKYVDERLLDAKLQVVEARTETKFAQVLGKLDAIGERLTGVETRLTGVEKKIGAVVGHVRNTKATIFAAILGTGIARRDLPMWRSRSLKLFCRYQNDVATTQRPDQ